MIGDATRQYLKHLFVPAAYRGLDNEQKACCEQDDTD
jgi:hypothetical protein